MKKTNPITPKTENRPLQEQINTLKARVDSLEKEVTALKEKIDTQKKQE